MDADIRDLPAGEAGLAVERLLVSALADPERRLGMEGHYNEAAYKDPRICDTAALVLSKRWPEKYQFHWAKSAPECDAQIARLRDRWRLDKGLSSPPPRASGVLPAAK